MIPSRRRISPSRITPRVTVWISPPLMRTGSGWAVAAVVESDAAAVSPTIEANGRREVMELIPTRWRAGRLPATSRQRSELDTRASLQRADPRTGCRGS